MTTETTTSHRTNFHPLLVGEVLDALASMDGPATTSEMSMAATTAMRRLVRQGSVTEKEVMTSNSDSGGYWEVTGATIARILGKRQDVVVIPPRPGNSQRRWATTANTERWEKKRQARAEVTATADARFTIQESPVQGWVKVLDTAKFSSVSTPNDAAVAIFDTDVLSIEVARELAHKVKRAVILKALAHAEEGAMSLTHAIQRIEELVAEDDEVIRRHPHTNLPTITHRNGLMEALDILAEEFDSETVA